MEMSRFPNSVLLPYLLQPAMNSLERANQNRARRPVLGFLSLFGFAALLLAIPVFYFLPGYTHMGGDRGVGLAFFGLFLFFYGCLPNMVLALIGLLRRETPWWPAAVDLTFSVLPFIAGAMFQVLFSHPA